ncbi:unnamed protein product [Euphydryas editha]|nr:unnamed protein product [Euphydryas editha]
MATRLTFYDPETDTAVELILSEEDARRAENDLQFATALMNSALQERATRQGKTTNVKSQQGDADNTDPDSPNTEGHSQSAHQGDTVTSEESGLYRWTTEMVLFLLDNYVEREEKFSSGKFSQKKNWEDIAEAMRSKSPLITGPQCAAKMRSLKKTYKSVKDHNNKSGNDRRKWLFYEKMDTIFQSKAWASPVAVASSSGVSSQRSQESKSEVSSESSSSRKTKENMASLLKKRLQQKKEEEEARAKRHKERMEMDEKMLALLSKLVENK